MNLVMDRRDLLKLAGVGTVVLASGLWKGEAFAKADDFLFLQISDTHIGFNNPKANPDFASTLKKEVESINSLKTKPDFIIFTGDLSHVADDDQERRKRLNEFKQITYGLKVKNVHFMPGEHDAARRRGSLQGSHRRTDALLFRPQGRSFYSPEQRIRPERDYWGGPAQMAGG